MAVSSPAKSRAGRSQRLDQLDEALLTLRRVFERAGYRRRLLVGLSRELEPATLRLLRTVQRAGEPPSVGAVAEVLVIDPSTASRLVERAVDAGLLERRTCSDDRRRARLYLTPAGDELLGEVTTRRRRLLAEVTDAWDETDLDQLVELLSQLQADFDQLERQE